MDGKSTKIENSTIRRMLGKQPVVFDLTSSDAAKHIFNGIINDNLPLLIKTHTDTVIFEAKKISILKKQLLEKIEKVYAIDKKNNAVFVLPKDLLVSR